jgi:CHAT domain-containing protein
MIDFHRSLRAANPNPGHIGGSAESLRQAALAMLKTPAYSHPLFWAPFIVLGSGW